MEDTFDLTQVRERLAEDPAAEAIDTGGDIDQQEAYQKVFDAWVGMTWALLGLGFVPRTLQGAINETVTYKAEVESTERQTA